MAFLSLSNNASLPTTFRKISLAFFDCYSFVVSADMNSYILMNNYVPEEFLQYRKHSSDNGWLFVKSELKTSSGISLYIAYEYIQVWIQQTFVILWWCNDSVGKKSRDEALIITLAPEQYEGMHGDFWFSKIRAALSTVFNQTLINEIQSSALNRSNVHCSKEFLKSSSSGYGNDLLVYIFGICAVLCCLIIIGSFLKRNNRIRPTEN